MVKKAPKKDEVAPSKSEVQQQNPLKDFALLMAVPAAIILIVALFTYIPRLLASPDYDFIYASCGTYRCANNFVVREGRVQERDSGYNDSYGYNEEKALYYYDVSEDSSRELTVEDAQVFDVDSTSKSPDGYTLERNRNGSGGFFLFWYDSDSEWELVNGSQKKTVDLVNTGDYYYNDVEFVGWVNP